MNQPGERHPRPDMLYDAYIPSFSPTQLPAKVNTFRNALLGADADYQGLCFAVARCLGTVASTPYAKYLYAFDPRITYDFSTYDSSVLPAVDAYSSEAGGLEVTGSRGTGAKGRGLATWHISWEDTGGGLEGVVTTTESTGSQFVAAGTVVKLPRSGLLVTSPQQPVAGEVWRISYRDIPGGFSETVDRIAESDGLIRSILPSGIPEPWNTFYSLTRHAMFPYRATGLILALAYTLEEYRVS